MKHLTSTLFMLICVSSAFGTDEVGSQCVVDPKDQIKASKHSPREGICVGNRVLSPQGEIGDVREISSHGLLKVKFSNSYVDLTAWKPQDLAVEVQCKSKICKGDRVRTSSGEEGTVMIVFKNGHTKVQFEGSDQLETWVTSDLKKLK